MWGYFDGYRYSVLTENGHDFLAKNVVKAIGTEDDASLPVKGHVSVGPAMKDPNGKSVPNFIYYCNDAYARYLFHHV